MVTGGHEGLWVQVLGPLEVWRGGRQIRLGPVKHRGALGLLAVAANTHVHRDEIVDTIWDKNSPATAVNLVQGYVSRLRSMLDPGRSPRDPCGLLVSSGTTYRLQATTDQLDLLAFEDLARQARARHLRGELDDACMCYERALKLWHGRPLADVDIMLRHHAVLALARRWVDVVLDYAETAQSAGLQDKVIRYLRELAAREPLNEKARARLMIALAGAGEQAAALATFEELRRRLDDELGVRPGAEVTDAHVRVLRQEIPLAAIREFEAIRVIARQLPGVMPHFTGRLAELRALSRLLEEAADPVGALRVAVISGPEGVGKTALAVRWAHQAAGQFPDGQLFVNLRGIDPSGVPVAPAEAIRGFLDALQVPPGCIPASVEGQVGLFRSLLASRRMLIVLDNALDEQQVRPLLPGSSGNVVLVTSRSQLIGLGATEGAGLLALDVLSEAEARELLTRRLGTERVEREREAGDELITLCARLPRALSITAARATARPGLPLAALAAELRGS